MGVEKISQWKNENRRKEKANKKRGMVKRDGQHKVMRGIVI